MKGANTMTIRQYAKTHNVKIVGKLRRLSSVSLKLPSVPTWIDDGGTEYWRVIHPVTHKPTWCIVADNGNII